MILFRLEVRCNLACPLITVCFLACIPVCYAENDPVSEHAYLQDFPVVLSASRLSQPLSEAPNAMTVIDRSMIKASGFRTITDLFRLVPGMYVGSLNGYTQVVGYHGSTEEYSRRMQVLIDGRSVYLPPFSTVDWEDIPLNMDDIERIEVVRGPAAASYGANSLQGVINIITRDAASVSGDYQSLTYGSEGVADVAAHMGQTGENMDFRLTMAHREDTGYGSRKLNDGKATNQANLRANFHPGGADSFDFQMGVSDSKRGLGIARRPDDLFRNAKVVSSFQQLGWLHDQQNGDELKLNYFHINRDYVDEGLASLNAGAVVPARTVADRHDLEMQHTAQLGKSNRLVWGAGIRSDYADSKEYLVVPYTIRQTRVFAHDEWRFISSALLNVGAMVEDDGLGHTNTSPRLALNYHVTPQHTLRASTSVAYRTPAIYEEHANVHGTTAAQTGSYVSQGNLQPEKTLSREVGYLGEFRDAGVTLDARAYNDQISNIVFVDPSATYWPFGFANLYSANYHGYEGTLKYRWSEKGNVAFNFSRQYMTCEATGVATNAATLLSSGIDLVAALQGYMDACPLAVPYNSGSVLLIQQLTHNVQASAGYYHQDGIRMIGTLTGVMSQSRMNRVDFRVARSFGKSGRVGSGELSLVVQNALEDDYTTYSTSVETNNIRFNRRAYIAAAFNF